MRAWVGTALVQRERNGAPLRVHGEVMLQEYLTLPTLSETGFFASPPNFPQAGENLQLIACAFELTICGLLAEL